MDFAKKASFRRYGCFSLSLRSWPRLLSIENTPAVLDTIRTDIVREVLATATDYI